MKTVSEYNKNKTNSFNLLFILFSTLGTAFVVEVVNRQYIHTILEWLDDHGSYFLLSWLLITGIYMLLLGVFNNVLISYCLLFGLLFFSSAASFFKMASRGEPLYANDFKYNFKVAVVTDPGGLFLYPPTKIPSCAFAPNKTPQLFDACKYISTKK